MSILIAPLIVMLVALGLTGRIAWLRHQRRAVSQSLVNGRHALWAGTAFSAVFACWQAGAFN